MARPEVAFVSTCILSAYQLSFVCNGDSAWLSTAWSAASARNMFRTVVATASTPSPPRASSAAFLSSNILPKGSKANCNPQERVRTMAPRGNSSCQLSSCALSNTCSQQQLSHLLLATALPLLRALIRIADKKWFHVPHQTSKERVGVVLCVLLRKHQLHLRPTPGSKRQQTMQAKRS